MVTATACAGRPATGARPAVSAREGVASPASASDTAAVRVVAPAARVRFELEGWFPRGLRPEERLRAPQGVSVDFAGHVYVAESAAGRVSVFTATGEPLGVIGSPGVGERRFQQPAGVSAGRAFTVYVSDGESDRLQVFDQTGAFGGWTPASEGELSRPWGIDLGPDGRLYVADRDDHRVVVVSAAGGVVDRLGSLGGGAAQLREPTFVAVNDVAIVVADTGNRRLQLFDLNGGYTGEVTGAAIPGGFVAPCGVDLDSDGTVFVADSTTARIVALDMHGALLGEAGRGAGDVDAPASPAGIVLAPGGRLYVADSRGGRVYIYRVRKGDRIPSPE